ncbi:hypothetical protein [Thermocoleostomius sinensis]|uniref:Bacteriocin n=1 Tax=Thermocoleostomius sinensis A174 TaxID=2016057 RepID=A0A9E8ZBB8_9CYAN|nr:hypothetical protein [Thermocoleostomius sinensis]WAL59998.1 hypothetical protein OXH18_22955 [Thermocoleostomius sinensis A174]
MELEKNNSLFTDLTDDEVTALNGGYRRCIVRRVYRCFWRRTWFGVRRVCAFQIQRFCY